MDLSHLDALQSRLSRERARLASAKTERERAFRAMNVEQAEREIAGERRFLVLADAPDDPPMTDDELLAALNA